MSKFRNKHLFYVFFLLLSGCMTFDPTRDQDRFDVFKVSAKESDNSEKYASERESVELNRIEDLPSPDYADNQRSRSDAIDLSFKDQEKITANFRNMPLPEFIQEALSKSLGLSYVLDPGLGDSPDLVTLSMNEPLSAEEFFQTTKTVLAEYGIALRKEGKILKVDLDQNASSERPLLFTGASLPDIPVTHRPVFVNYTLRVTRPAQVRNTIMQLYPNRLFVGELPEANSILLKGPADLVRDALAAVKSFDQPLVTGKFSAGFRPIYLTPSELSRDLERVLRSEGYAVSTNPPYAPIIILPFDEQQRILVFSASKKVLEHVLEWANNLDSDRKDSIADDFFTYEAKNLTAQHIAGVVSALETGSGAAVSGGASSVDNKDGAFGGRTGGREGRSSIGSFMNGKLVIDGNRNVLFFKGSGKEWGRIRRLIEQIDLPIPMVLIDVSLVEITLNEGENSGIEWFFKGSGGSDYNLRGSTLGGLSLGGNGLSLVLDSAGQTRSILNAFYQSDKASIRSSPKLLVKSGETATIEVGNEIPILSSTAQSLDADGAPILQTVTYRKTGVQLSINPIVQASGLVDLLIRQELSEQQSTGTLGSPIILQRSLDTALSIKDGGSVLLGGLISDNQGDGQTGLPALSRIPLVRKLFSVDAKSAGRTELMMLVSTFVLKSHDDAVEITRGFKEGFKNSD